MTRGDQFLVVGGDSLVGGSLVAALGRRGRPVLASTRRTEQLAPGRVRIDFEDASTFQAPNGSGYAFVVAAATNYERCEKDPSAHRINVELIPQYVASLLAQGLFVTFISTNSVFGGDHPWPHEDDPHAPGIPYAKQKAEAERRIMAAARELGATARLNIVRLTKILSLETPPLPGWLASWKRGEPVQPFADLIFAPLSARFVGEALATIGERRIAGNLHLSGKRNISYLDLALGLAAKIGVPENLIQATTSEEKGVTILFKPRFSGLGMARTLRETDVAPQTLNAVIDDLLPAAGGRNFKL